MLNIQNVSSDIHVPTIHYDGFSSLEIQDRDEYHGTGGKGTPLRKKTHQPRLPCKKLTNIIIKQIGGVDAITYLHRLLNRWGTNHLTDEDLARSLSAIQQKCPDFDVDTWKTLCEAHCYASRPRGGGSNCLLGLDGERHLV
jgi:hypothetical protein